MSEKWTKGPWVIDGTVSTHNEPVRVWETRVTGPANATVLVGVGATEEESIANAAIGAASKALAEALRETLEAVKSALCEFNDIDYEELTHLEKNVVKTLQTSIPKAEAALRGALGEL